MAGDLPAWLQSAAALAGTAGTAWWLTRNERTKRSEDQPASADAGTQVVAATFTERSLMQNLTAALAKLDGTITASNEVSGDLVELLRAEAQRRHDEAVVREALRKRGILE